MMDPTLRGECDHELTLLRRPVTTAPPRFDRFSCSKCLAVLWVPIEHPQFIHASDKISC
jgi:hypothetical protein